MADLIDRQAAIDAATRFRVNPGGEFFEAIKRAIRRELEALPAAEPKSYRMGYQAGYKAAQRWIPCSERLPEDDVEVLVTDDAGGVQWLGVDKMMSYEDGSGRFWLISQHPSAWMPLPEPYKEAP